MAEDIGSARTIRAFTNEGNECQPSDLSMSTTRSDRVFTKDSDNNSHPNSSVFTPSQRMASVVHDTISPVSKSTVSANLYREDPNLYYALCLLGIISPDSTKLQSSLWYFSWFMFGLVRSLIVINAGYFLQSMLVSFILGFHKHDSVDNQLFIVYDYCCAMLQSLVFLPVVIMLRDRLEIQAASPTHSMYLRGSRTVFFGTWIITSLTFLAYPLSVLATNYRSPFDPPVYYESDMYLAFLIVCELNNCLFLSATMLIFAADASLALALVMELQKMTTQQVLTPRELRQTKQNMRDMQRDNASVFLAVSVVGALNVLAMIIRVYINYQRWESAVAAIGIYSKELPFVFVLGWKAAQVNDAADELLLQLSQQQWETEPDEWRRLKLFAIEVGHPIAFKMLGRRIGSRQFMLETAGLVLALTLGFLRVMVYLGRVAS